MAKTNAERQREYRERQLDKTDDERYVRIDMYVPKNAKDYIRLLASKLECTFGEAMEIAGRAAVGDYFGMQDKKSAERSGHLAYCIEEFNKARAGQPKETPADTEEKP